MLIVVGMNDVTPSLVIDLAILDKSLSVAYITSDPFAPWICSSIKPGTTISLSSKLNKSFSSSNEDIFPFSNWIELFTKPTFSLYIIAFLKPFIALFLLIIMKQLLYHKRL